MPQYRIVMGTQEPPLFKVQKKGWFLWRDLKQYSWWSRELGPQFSTTWHTNVVDARASAHNDSWREFSRKAKKRERNRIIEEITI